MSESVAKQPQRNNQPWHAKGVFEVRAKQTDKGWRYVLIGPGRGTSTYASSQSAYDAMMRAHAIYAEGFSDALERVGISLNEVSRALDVLPKKAQP